MNIKCARIITFVAAAWMSAVSCERAHAQVETAHDLHVKGLNVLRISFPTQGELKNFSLKLSFDGETFHETSSGLPRPWQLFRSVAYGDTRTTIIVPVVAGFQVGRFIFEVPTSCWFRWNANFKDDQTETIEIQQIGRVRPATEADLAFIAGLGEKHMAQAMFGEDFFERQTGNAIEYYADPEVRAVKVIGELLRATRAKEPGDVVGSRRTLEQAVSAGNALWQLAKRLPESSYAPYAAYFAGCSFTVRVMHENKEAHGRLISPAGRNSEYYEEGQEAFTLATTRGDDYLKPRALYHAAFLRICGGEFDKGEELLAKAERAAPGEGTIRTMVSTLRRDIARTRSKLEQADGEPDDDD